MRITLILSCILVASASAGSAQDLQYRMTMKATSKVEPTLDAMPATVSTISVKGDRLRIDATPAPMLGGVSSIIKDDTMYMLLNDEAKYMKQSLNQRPAVIADTAAERRFASYIPQMKETGETRTIAGFPAVRRIWTVELPRGEAAALPIVRDTGAVLIVGESWSSSDSTLNAASKIAFQNMAALARRASPLDALSADQAEHFVFSNVMVFVRRPAGDYDVEKILRGNAGVHEISRITMTADEISLAPLPDSFFQLPTNYTPIN